MFSHQLPVDIKKLTVKNFEFVKMHSLGNDFVVIDGIEQKIFLTSDIVKAIAHRRTGVGCDQILLVKSIRGRKNIFEFRIFNADGSESSQCGNGACCVASLIYERAYSTGKELILQTNVDSLQCTIGQDRKVTAALGVPHFSPSDVPFLADSEEITYPLEVNGKSLSISALSIGNPHAVMVVPDINNAPVEETGASIESHARFPERANVGYMQVETDSSISLRVFERGVGETLACGSGAGAAVIAGQRMGLLGTRVTVKFAIGEAVVEWKGAGSPVFLTASTSRAYRGELHECLDQFN